MPTIFEKIRLIWNGKEYSIPPDQVMMCIAKVEDVITMKELAEIAEKKSLPLGKISMAFGAVLRHAGADVSDEEVYDGMFKGGAAQRQGLQAINALLSMMVPPKHLRGTEEPEPGKDGAARARDRLSKKRTKQQPQSGE